MKENAAGLPWMPAIDGLRAIAVASVVLYHYDTQPLFPGGLFGVDLFFAISGFLITALLVREFRADSSVDLGRFFLRRALRIVPAVLALVVVYTMAAAGLSSLGLAGSRTMAASPEVAILAVSHIFSWLVALEQVEPGAFEHLWSLSVEEQFYLLWPLLLVSLLRAGVRIPIVIALAASLACLSASVPMLLGGDPSWYRVAFGADYRAHGLLAGSVAGLLAAEGYLQSERLRCVPFYAAIAASVAFLAGLLLFVDSKTILAHYQLGFPLISIAATTIVLAASRVTDGAWLAVLGNPVITYVGRRSYAIYLWHYPVGLALHDLDTLPQLLIAGSITLIAAELSHRCVERPAFRLRTSLARPHATAQPALPVNATA